jgi:hypothetical protein
LVVVRLATATVLAMVPAMVPETALVSVVAVTTAMERWGLECAAVAVAVAPAIAATAATPAIPVVERLVVWSPAVPVTALATASLMARPVWPVASLAVAPRW